MKLTPPKVVTFWIAVILALLGLIFQVFNVAAISPYAFWILFVGFVLLALGLVIKGL